MAKRYRIALLNIQNMGALVVSYVLKTADILDDFSSKFLAGGGATTNCKDEKLTLILLPSFENLLGHNPSSPGKF